MMIRQMEHGEEDSVRALFAELSYEDQTLWRKQTKPLEAFENMINQLGFKILTKAKQDG